MSQPPTAAAVGGLFFPQTKSLGIDRTEWSPTLQRKIVRAGTQNGSFAQGSADLREYLSLEVGVKQVERVTERIGWERCDERDAAVERYMSLPLVERKGKPPAVEVPEVAVVTVDGGRLQIRHDRQTSTATGDPARRRRCRPTRSTGAHIGVRTRSVC